MCAGVQILSRRFRLAALKSARVGRAVLLSQSQNRQSEFRYDIADVSAELSSPPLALFGRQLQSQFFQPRPSRLEDSYQVDRGVRQTSGSRRSQSCAVPVSCRDAWCIPTCAASALHGRALRLRSRMKAWSVAGLPIAAAASRFRVLRSPSRCAVAWSGDGSRMSVALWAEALVANRTQEAMAARYLRVVCMTAPSKGCAG